MAQIVAPESLVGIAFVINCSQFVLMRVRRQFCTRTFKQRSPKKNTAQTVGGQVTVGFESVLTMSNASPGSGIPSRRRV